MELTQGSENYTLPDAMLQFAKTNKLTVRGQNVVCDDVKYQRPWLKELGPEDMKAAVLKRVNSLVTRYKGQLAHWDVVNENMHYYYFSNLDPGKFSSNIFKLVHQLDPTSLPFLNDFGSIEACDYDDPAMPSDYLDKIAEIRTGGYSGPLGIGVQGHFFKFKPNLPYARAAIDILASTGLPLWITEFDVNLNVNTVIILIQPPSLYYLVKIIYSITVSENIDCNLGLSSSNVGDGFTRAVLAPRCSRHRVVGVHGAEREMLRHVYDRTGFQKHGGRRCRRQVHI